MKTINFIPGIIIILALILVGCTPRESGSGSTQQLGSQNGTSQTGKPQVDLSGFAIDGAGASFPFPIYSMWAFEFGELSGMQINYQSVGSGAGISSIKEKTVDFGASDAPLPAEELDEFGLLQFPMIIGGVVPVINVEGIGAGELKLSSEVFAGIFLGDITTWNDPAIASINPRVNLPDEPITVVHRADGSGTTWIFSNYLSRVSTAWADKVGIGKSLDWPVGNGMPGNEGVANNVSRIDGSIGYVEYAYAVNSDMTWCHLENKDGNYAPPSIESFMAAAENADWENAPGYYMVLVNQPGEDTWPITGASFILIHREQDDAEKARSMLEFFEWCFTNGKARATELDYVPIPENVIELIHNTWSEQLTVEGVKIW